MRTPELFPNLNLNGVLVNNELTMIQQCNLYSHSKKANILVCGRRAENIMNAQICKENATFIFSNGPNIHLPTFLAIKG